MYGATASACAVGMLSSVSLLKIFTVSCFVTSWCENVFTIFCTSVVTIINDSSFMNFIMKIKLCIPSSLYLTIKSDTNHICVHNLTERGADTCI